MGNTGRLRHGFQGPSYNNSTSSRDVPMIKPFNGTILNIFNNGATFQGAYPIPTAIGIGSSSIG